MSRVLCIAGMHRSGTSLMASWLESCGVRMHAGRVLGPGPGNRRGHFEDADFTDLHRAAIDRHVHGAAGWIVTDRTAVEPDDELRRGAQNLLAARVHESGVWGWKDPRTSLFLEFWKALIPDLKALLVWRPAVEVLESIRARARGTPRGLRLRIGGRCALDLWRAHNQAILDYKRTHPADTVLVSTEAAIEADLRLIAALDERLGVSLHRVSVATVYTPGMLKTYSPSWLTRMVAGRRPVSELEDGLRAASDRL